MSRRVFVAGGPAHIRSTILPVDAEGLSTTSSTAPDNLATLSVDTLRHFVQSVRSNNIYDEALLLANPRFRRRLLDLDLDAPENEDQFGDTAVTCLKYLLRMSTRPTPFGLFAGVGLVEDAEEHSGLVRRNLRRHAQPDHTWLNDVVGQLLKRPEVRRVLRFQFNDFTVERNGRLIAPAPPATADAEATSWTRRASVRLTEAVQEIRRVARTPMPHRDLCAALRRQYPGTSPDRIEQVLSTLLEAGLLVDELRPRTDMRNPLAHVSRTIASVAPDESESLSEVSAALRCYEQSPMGEGAKTLDKARAVMRPLQSHPELDQVKVDLIADYGGGVPPAVLSEAELSAGALLSLVPPATEELRLQRYRERFMERYGLGELVPLREATDPVVGIGLPGEDNDWEIRKTLERGALGTTSPLLRGLAEFTSDALARDEEVVITDDLVEEAALQDRQRWPRSVDLGFVLESRSNDELRRGVFRLWHTGLYGPERGAASGRFWHALNLDPSIQMTGEAPAAPDAGDAVPVQLLFEPLVARQKNVVGQPLGSQVILSAGVLEPDVDRVNLRLDDLWLGATRDRMVVYTFEPPFENGRELVVRSPHMLAMSLTMPSVLKLLVDIGRTDTGTLIGWQWGSLASLPHHPRVRYRRTVLSPARWRVNRELVSSREASERWARRFEKWRLDHGVPDVVQLGGDQRITIDLKDPLHVAMLRGELADANGELRESPYADNTACGWAGGFATEMVVPLERCRPARQQFQATMPLVRRGPSQPLGPASGWLTLHVFTAAEFADALLVDGVSDLVQELGVGAGTLFFVRYADPQFHLRVRLRGEPEVLRNGVQPALEAWVARQQEARLARGYTITTYERETMRYGGAGCIELAEELFAADSMLCLKQLGRLERPVSVDRQHSERLATIVSSYIGFLEGLAGLDWAEWVVSNVAASSTQLGNDERSSLRDLLRPAAVGDWANVTPAAAAETKAWTKRSAASARYWTELTGASESQALGGRRDHALRSILHMTHNRLGGLDKNSEGTSLWLLRQMALSICRRK